MAIRHQCDRCKRLFDNKSALTTINVVEPPLGAAQLTYPLELCAEDFNDVVAFAGTVVSRDRHGHLDIDAEQH